MTIDTNSTEAHLLRKLGEAVRELNTVEAIAGGAFGPLRGLLMSALEDGKVLFRKANEKP